ncbi:MAG TPA: two-component regulator propeller domain-containing protein [Verrucomicrobiae bacterium]
MIDQSQSIRRRFTIGAMSALALAVVQGMAVAATEAGPAAELVFRAWDTVAGLPQNSVTAITQTRDGYLWLGTRDGLARFDGVRFRVFGLEEGLQSVDIQAVFEDRQGALWIGSYGGGLAKMVGNRCEVVPAVTRSAGSDIVTALAEDATGRLWVGTRAGLRFLQHGRLVEDSAFGQVGSAPIRALLKDRQGGMWVATSGEGLHAWREGRLALVPGPFADPRIGAHCLMEDRRGWLWASIGNGMVLCRQEDVWRVYGETNGLPFAYVTCLAEDAEGRVWAGSLDDGLYCFDGERFRVVRQTDGLSANDIRSLLLDRESNLWVGTRTGGLNRLNRRRLLHCGVAQGLTNDYTRSVAQTADRMLWVGTTGGGIYRGNEHHLVPFRPEPFGITYAHVESVLAARDGSVWWGAAVGLLRWKEDRLVACVTNESWIQASSVTALQEDSQDGVWLGTLQGRLVHWHDGRFEEFPQRVARGPISALAVQPDGWVWVGSGGGGLRRIRRGDDAVLTVTNGLRSPSIRALHLDAEGTIWIGTAGGGLSCWRDGVVASFTEAHGLNARTVSQIIEDDFGHLWLGTSRGILKVRKQDLADCANGRLGFIHTRSYGANDGMPAEECSGGFCPAGLKTREGLLCFSTVRGLVFVNPHEDSAAAAVPEAMLEEALVNGRTTPVGTGRAAEEIEALDASRRFRLVIPPGERALELRYTAIQFKAPERVGFRYRLEGADQDWVEAGARRAAYYQRLIPGDYVFRVTACNADGVWSGQEASLAITVLPVFYETGWFRAGAALGVAAFSAGALGAVLRRRYQRRLARLQMQHAVERERLRISQDMHDHVGGILTQVSQLSDMGQGETGEAARVRNLFERIGNQARVAVQALDEIVWATNPKNDNLASFAEYVSRFTDECFEYTNIRCWQEIPASLPSLPLRAEVRHNVFLAVREAFHNVLKHSRATEVWLRLGLEGSRIFIEVEDNGCGFDAAVIAPGGNGLGNMRARLAEEGGHAEVTSLPGRGTKVRFVFPLGS